MRCKTLLPLLFVGLAHSHVGCDEITAGEVITPPPVTDVFELTYVSGHLGSYHDCPSDALSPPSATGPQPAGARAEDADCAEDAPCGPFNCEHAEVTVSLKNTGETALVGLQVTGILLRPETGEGALTSELLGVTRDDGQPLDAAIAPGAEVALIVEFKGVPPTFDDSWFGAGEPNAPVMHGSQLKVELRFETTDYDATVSTPGLATLPMVAT